MNSYLIWLMNWSNMCQKLKKIDKKLNTLKMRSDYYYKLQQYSLFVVDHENYP